MYLLVKYANILKRTICYWRNRKVGSISRGTKDQLLIDKLVIKNCKWRMTNLCLAWIDCKKAYDMVPHSWIIQCLQMFKISKNMERLIANSMNSLKVKLTAGTDGLGMVIIRRGIFQGDSLSPILFFLCFLLSFELLNGMGDGYKLEKNLNHLLYMDDLKLYTKMKKSLTQFCRR